MRAMDRDVAVVAYAAAAGNAAALVAYDVTCLRRLTNWALR